MKIMNLLSTALSTGIRIFGWVDAVEVHSCCFALKCNCYCGFIHNADMRANL